MQRHLAAILVTDVAGYSRLMGIDESATLAALRSHRDEVVLPAIERHRGRLANTAGDGMLVEFSSVVGAVECAVAIQTAMIERNRTVDPARRIEFRMGVNLDEVIADGDDILGDGVNVAARLESEAEPGTVCISGSVFAQVKNRIDLRFEDLGEQRLKNIADPVRIFRIRCGDADFPLAAYPPACPLPLPQKPSVALLPFVSQGGDGSDEYLADGLRLDIQAALVKASGLFLIAPGTTARYRNREISVEQAGQQMGVRFVLEGSVQRSGTHIRVTVALTDVVERRVVWSEQYDRVFEDGFAVQDEIAAEVLKALDVKLASGEKWLLHSSLKSREVLECFYQALSRFYAGTKEDNAAARDLFERVAALQPDSSIGPAYLCFCHWVDAFRGWSASREQSLTQAARWAERAVKHSRTNGLAHIVLASVHLLAHRHDEALAECYRAVELRPNCPTANSYLANVLHFCGRPAEAIAKIMEAIRITPVYPPWYMSVLAASYRENGDIAQSIAAARRGVDLTPADIEPRLILCADLAMTDRLAEARRESEAVLAIDPGFSSARYVADKPFRDDAVRQRLAADLRAAGLPD